MSRPLNKDVEQGQQGWDADVRDNFKVLMQTPMPVPNGTFELANGTTEGAAYTSSGGLPTASLYEGCLASVNNGGVWELYFSDGSTWRSVNLT